jgi:NAD(P)-dependent dehydrogenase (short-subunit alcohol dehydrogenase family)
MRRLEGRTGIVTGAAQGIGAATAKRLASEGARIVVADLNVAGAQSVAHEISEAGGDAIAIGMDLHDEASLEAMVASCIDHYGGLQILHNNAADMRPAFLHADLAAETMTVEVWDGVFRANTRGTMLATKYALPALLKGDDSAIINTSSGASLTGDLYRPAYGASKAAINAFTKYVATQYGKRGVRCNAVSPGIVITAAAEAANSPERLEIFMRHVLSPRIGRPEDIAAVVAMLASDDGRYVNGQVISVDGGIQAHFAHVADITATFWEDVEALRSATDT